MSKSESKQEFFNKAMSALEPLRGVNAIGNVNDVSYHIQSEAFVDPNLESFGPKSTLRWADKNKRDHTLYVEWERGVNEKHGKVSAATLATSDGTYSLNVDDIDTMLENVPSYMQDSFNQMMGHLENAPEIRGEVLAHRENILARSRHWAPVISRMGSPLVQDMQSMIADIDEIDQILEEKGARPTIASKDASYDLDSEELGNTQDVERGNDLDAPSMSNE